MKISSRMFRASVLALAIVSLCTSLPALSADPWDGTWKLDTEHSQLSGETFTYSRGSNGMWNVSNGGPVSINFAPDGKPYRSFSDDETVSFTQEGPRAWTSSRQYKGTEWEVTREELSADGQMLTDHEEVTNPDHTVSRVTTLYKRVGPGEGFAGKWMSTQIMGHYTSGWVFANRFVLLTTGPDRMRWNMPDDQMTIEGPLDGSMLRLSGEDDKAGVGMQLRRVSAREITMAIWRDGKEERDYRFNLAPDAKTFTCASWAPETA